MKNKFTLLTALAAISIFSSTLLAMTPKLDGDYNEIIPSEVSAVLTSKDYSKAIEEQTQKYLRKGYVLRIVSIDSTTIGTSTFIYFYLAAKPTSTKSGWMPAGTLVGSIKYIANGNIRVEGVYFKPNDEAPGGASIGNH